MKSRFALAVLVAAAAIGCEKPAEPEKAEEPKPVAVESEEEKQTPATTAEVAVGSEPKTQVTGVPTTEDFEEEAAETITSENMEAELDKLEKELAQTEPE